MLDVVLSSTRRRRGICTWLPTYLIMVRSVATATTSNNHNVTETTNGRDNLCPSWFGNGGTWWWSKWWKLGGITPSNTTLQYFRYRNAAEHFPQPPVPTNSASCAPHISAANPL